MLCPNMAPCLLVIIFLTTFALSESDESAASMDDDSSLPMLSGKRQHNIMRFGKRPSGGHNLIHFGKRGNEAQHRFLYLGKREEEEDNPIFPFLQRGEDYKRGHTIMRFGKRDKPQDMHNFIRFGKRDSAEEEEEKRGTGGHSMMYFGKRGPGHNMMYFGKRGAGHSMLYFGKRNDDYDPDVVLVPEEEAEKRAHSMIHFGKREDEDGTEESKRGGGSHSMIHFGKRPFLEEQEELNESQLPIFWTPEMNEKRNILRFGKKTEGSRARNSHAMIHFGKRSIDNDPANKTEELVTRTKRDAAPIEGIESVLRYYYPRNPTVWDENSNLMEYDEPEKKDGSKNVFLRFG